MTPAMRAAPSATWAVVTSTFRWERIVRIPRVTCRHATTHQRSDVIRKADLGGVRRHNATVQARIVNNTAKPVIRWSM
jgi:hypothetical protein